MFAYRVNRNMRYVRFHLINFYQQESECVLEIFLAS